MTNVLVIFGGKSSEYEVSLNSAYSVICNMPRDKYNIIKLGVTKEGEWLYYDGEISKIPSGEWVSLGVKAYISPDYGEKTLNVLYPEGAKKIHIDACFPVLHGKNGEDGSLAALLTLAGIPYVGSSPLSAAMCMDKSVTNLLAEFYGVKEAKWLSITKRDYEKGKSSFMEKCSNYLGFPLFVKPANAGSSVGVAKVASGEFLAGALENAFKEDKKIVAEENIDGREIECSVLGEDDPIVSIPGEIIPSAEFYDYDAKYKSNSKLIIPAPLPPEKTEEIRETALKIYKSLCCKSLSRVDFFLRKSDNALLFNEINTMPGFTEISMYPKLFEASGIPYPELIDRLIKNCSL